MNIVYKMIEVLVIVGDMTDLVITDFRTGKQTKLIPKAEDVEGYKNSGHGGGDWLLARDFVQAVAQQSSKPVSYTHLTLPTKRIV